MLKNQLTLNNPKPMVSIAKVGKVLMDTCKNIKTGATFILVEELSNDKAIMITPDGRVKPLEIKFFKEFKTGQEIRDLMKRGEITGQQIKRFNMYKES
jgi:hypothetical protein